LLGLGLIVLKASTEGERRDGAHQCAASAESKRVRLYSRPGNDLTQRFPLIVEALARLRSRSCIIDGEAVACGDHGVALFERIRYRRFDSSVFMYAFDLIELNGDDLRREPLEWRDRPCEAHAVKPHRREQVGSICSSGRRPMPVKSLKVQNRVNSLLSNLSNTISLSISKRLMDLI
jgi:hypothetical protein